jgi:hypothetical protein
MPHHFTSDCGLIYVPQFGSIEQEISDVAKLVWYVYWNKCGILSPLVDQWGFRRSELIELPWLPYTTTKDDAMKYAVLV